MMGIEIELGDSPFWRQLTFWSALFSLGLGIGVGPKGIYVASGLGAIAAMIGLCFQKKRTFLWICLALHAVFLVVGSVLDGLFLRPLPEKSLIMPRLAQSYRDPGGIFKLRAPYGWTTEGIHTPTETGVRLRPTERHQYMGVSELTVRVKELENANINQMDLLKRMAQSLAAAPPASSKLFEFSVTPAQLLNKKQGMWCHLIVKRFWIPLYQRALFGIKQKRYLCTVSAAGLKNHETLAHVLCLGVFETIEVLPQEKAKTR